jgi:hypothetical protein
MNREKEVCLKKIVFSQRAAIFSYKYLCNFLCLNFLGCLYFG